MTVATTIARDAIVVDVATTVAPCPRCRVARVRRTEGSSLAIWPGGRRRVLTPSKNGGSLVRRGTRAHGWGPSGAVARLFFIASGQTAPLNSAPRPRRRSRLGLQADLPASTCPLLLRRILPEEPALEQLRRVERREPREAFSTTTPSMTSTARPASSASRTASRVAFGLAGVPMPGS